MILFRNIGELAGTAPEGLLRKQGTEMADAGILHDAWLAVEDGRIVDFGTGPAPEADETVDAAGGMILPPSATATPIWCMPDAATGSSSTRSTA